MQTATHFNFHILKLVCYIHPLLCSLVEEAFETPNPNYWYRDQPGWPGCHCRHKATKAEAPVHNSLLFCSLDTTCRQLINSIRRKKWTLKSTCGGLNWRKDRRQRQLQFEIPSKDMGREVLS